MNLPFQTLVPTLALFLLTSCTTPQEHTTTTPSISDSSSSSNSSSDSSPDSSPDSSSDVFTLQFQTTTLEGTPISSDIFQDYDLTIVNVWATWCGPCVDEMPHLQEVYENLPDNVNLLTLCTDGDTQAPLAEEILTYSHATFQTLLLDNTLSSTLMPMIRAFPTTLFILQDGTLFTAVEGAPSGDITAVYLSLVEQVLQLMEEEKN